MYAVIFKARAGRQGQDYLVEAESLRALALSKYGCVQFVSVSEKGREIAISYWPTLAAIEAWKNDPQHQHAQQMGKQRWYENYEVEVVEVLRRYSNKTDK